VSSATVEQILRENRYVAVTKPSAGDVIVYRDATGVVQHTGLVKVVGEDGLVLIESKWGELGRYLHAADVRAYMSCSATYYRSERGGHVLREAEYRPAVTTERVDAQTKEGGM